VPASKSLDAVQANREEELGRACSKKVTIPGSTVSFEMVLIPGGQSEISAPQAGSTQKVQLQSFWIGKQEVSWDEFALFCADCPDVQENEGFQSSLFSDAYEDNLARFTKGRYPALGIHWFLAMRYCDWLSTKTEDRYRLPTEAEWEHACRAGSSGATSFPLDDHAWYEDNSNQEPQSTGFKRPNAFGLYDMLGNAWEHTLEPFAPPALDPVLKGGGWDSPAQELRYSSRQTIKKDWYERDPNRPRSLWWLTDGVSVGFRVVLQISPDEESYISKIDVRDVKPAEPSKGFTRITGEIWNIGDRTLGEVEVTASYLDQIAGAFSPQYERPRFNRTYPVLVNSYHEGPHRQPLKPGEKRPFHVSLPDPADGHPLVEKRFRVRVTGVQLLAP
jgi:formylglycine-generating enzyme required for sulfatase activity